MSRMIRRVPLDFATPLGKTWEGYLTPNPYAPTPCAACGSMGWSDRYKQLEALWYGDAPFRPEDNGSTPLTVDHPAVRAFAERNVSTAPWYYGTGEAAIVREAARLAHLWNGRWRNHLNDDDVALLAAENRLMDFTHTYTRGEGWTPKDPPVVPTAAEVNTWAIENPMGHDCSTAWTLIQARCVRELAPIVCPCCDGKAGHWASPEEKAAYGVWECPDPPTGDGWQLWQTVSEGGPVTPVFATPEQLVEHLATLGEHHEDGRVEPYSRAAAEAMVAEGWAPSGISTGGTHYRNADALVAMRQERN